MDMREEKAATVTLEEVAELSRKVTADALQIGRMIRGGNESDDAICTAIETNYEDQMQLAEMMMLFLNNAVIGQFQIRSVNLPFIAAAFGATTDYLLQAMGAGQDRQLCEKVRLFLQEKMPARTVAVSAEAFEAMRAQAQGDERTEKKGTEEE